MGAHCILLHLWICQYYFINAALMFQSFLNCHSHKNTSQDTEGSVISTATPVVPQCVYLAVWQRATLTTPKQNINKIYWTQSNMEFASKKLVCSKNNLFLFVCILAQNWIFQLCRGAEIHSTIHKYYYYSLKFIRVPAPKT